MIPFEWLDLAAKRISGHVIQTPVSYDEKLNIHLKWENKQVTGSFKIRGALNKILSLEEWEQKQGLVTASAGNHGQGVAMAGKLVGAPVVVFASDHAVPTKVDAMRKQGAEVRFVNGGYGLAEATAVEYANHTQSIYISPYNDGQVIAGQGTIGLEILQEVDHGQKETWVIPVGGGGLISGIGAVLQRQKERPRLVGVQPEASAFTYALFHKGDQNNVADLPTLADGLSGPVQTGSITIPMIKNLVDDLLIISENEIEHAIAYAWFQYHEVIEGSAAIALAAVLMRKVKSPAIIVLSGGNIQLELHDQICKKFAGRI
jgi:threonine dehydratase